MSKVLITRSKLDDLATTIAAKSGATLPLTIAQMDAAVEGIDTSGSNFVVTLSYNDQTEMWEPDCTYAELSAAAQAGKNIVVKASDGTADGEWLPTGELQYITYKVQGSRVFEGLWWFTSEGVVEDETLTAIFPNFESPSHTYTPTTQQQTETITYDSSQGYNGMQQVSVTVNPIPTNYGLITYNGSSLMVS